MYKWIMTMTSLGLHMELEKRRRELSGRKRELEIRLTWPSVPPHRPAKFHRRTQFHHVPLLFHFCIKDICLGQSLIRFGCRDGNLHWFGSLQRETQFMCYMAGFCPGIMPASPWRRRIYTERKPNSTLRCHTVNGSAIITSALSIGIGWLSAQQQLLYYCI